MIVINNTLISLATTVFCRASQVALGGKEHSCQCRRHKRCFYLCVMKILWRRAWQPTPVFLPGESPWTEDLGGLRFMGLQRVGHDGSNLAHLYCYVLNFGNYPAPYFICLRKQSRSAHVLCIKRHIYSS